jgi:HEAT repeat protein
MRLRVGREWPAADGGVDLGAVTPQEGAEYLIAAAHHLAGRSASSAVVAAAIAQGATIWPALLDLARDAGAPRGAREDARFWLGRILAGREGLPVDEDDEGDEAEGVRGAAVFALSQLDDDRGVPDLIALARSHRDPWVRSRAIFWLSQSDDPRALDFLAERLRAAR